jgi:Ca-activated chloride channel family protein
MNHPLSLLAVAFALLVSPAFPAPPDAEVTTGRLDAVGPDGQALGPCPLQHTAVEAELSGTLARVSVTQRFHNPFQEKIEAVYVFPLHQDSAVDELIMTVGERVVKGVIKERGEARRIYTEAKNQGKVAALLDQERPNIFTQAVANIEPGQQVTITIRYSQTLTWEDGCFGFDFPTVVGPRYIPGASSGAAPGAARMPSLFHEPPIGRGPQGEPPVVNPEPVPPTDQVPDADRITPPVVAEGFRAGHDLSITVRIQAGLPLHDLKSALHEITIDHPAEDPTRAVVKLAEKSVLPNRDFVLTYRTAGDGITDAVLTHTDERGKFFTLILQPPARVKQAEVVPRELVFVLDTSGSMNGFPLETSKALIRRAIETLRPNDRFNLLTFAGATRLLAPKPLANTEANRHRALRFIDTLQGAGGTEMMPAIQTVLGRNLDPDKVRIVCFLTDGYVGNEQALIEAVRKHAGTTRVFSFGIGSSVNRFLLDSMAQAGRGEAHYVLTHESARKAADTFYAGIDAPVLTDIALDFGGLAVEEVYPQRVGDLFAAKPVVVKGRYATAGAGVIRLKGRNAAGAFTRELAVTLPAENPENSVLAAQWARAKVGHLMLQGPAGGPAGRPKFAVQQAILELGLTYHLLTQFTSFVAVEEQHTTEGGQPRTIQVPLEMPQGVSHSGVFGRERSAASGFGDGDDFGSGWGSGADGSGGGGGFGNIPATMKKRCSKADRLERLAANGGTPACEDAVVKTLDWLKQRQNPDGSWCAANPTAPTGLALLAYLGHCETPLSEQYGETVLKAIVFLVTQATQHAGRLTSDPNDPLAPHAHAIATCALAEACTFSRQLKLTIPGLEETVRAAGQWIIDQQAATGGWDAPPAPSDAKGGGDVLLACLNLQALKACRHTGLDFRKLNACASKALDHLKVGQDAADPALVSPLAGARALAYQQWAKGSDKLPQAACEAIARQFKFRWHAPGADLGTLYFNAHAMLNSGGGKWSEFNAMILPEILSAQLPDGSFKDPGVAADDTRHPLARRLQGDAEAAVHCRTCLAALTLEVYYRFLPGIGQQP